MKFGGKPAVRPWQAQQRIIVEWLPHPWPARVRTIIRVRPAWMLDPEGRSSLAKSLMEADRKFWAQSVPLKAGGSYGTD